jgi:membrane-bound lytic murein transglycosylase D
MLALLLAGCEPSTPTSAHEGADPQSTAPALPSLTQQAVPPAVPLPLTFDQRRVHALIQQVESTYSQGEADYRKGKLPEAKAEFDRAVDLMLTSGIDIKSDAQLQEEFDRIVDAVNALEMEALKLGNGFAPKEEPTPADVASEMTFEVDPNIVAKARAELATTKSDLPLVVNDYVASYINFFANTKKGHATLLHSFQRAGRYKAMIQRVMAEEGVPQDLIYLAVAESGFNPRALNRRSGAGGMWQFMPNDKYYGLARTAYVDERFDPEKSTRASARYMKFIYDQTGDWYLTMAGYNWGTGRVQHAVEKTGYADFWELYKRNELPRETANYVPEILAAIIIANNPTQYGFDDLTLDPPVLTDTLTINYSVDLRLVSDLLGAPVDELEALNPSLLRMITPPDAPFDLHLPAGTATLYTQRIAEIPEGKRNSWRYHRVVSDDTLASVAREYRVPVAELAAANQLSETESIRGLEAVIVPVPPAAAPSAHMQLYTARRGDTLVTIADRFGVSLSQLRRWNKVTGIKVEAGRRLRVAEPANVARTSRSRHHAASASGAKTPATAPAKGSQAKTSGRAEEKQKAAPGATSHAAKSTNSAAGAAKTGTPGKRKARAHKGPSHAKPSTSKQK